MMTIPSDVLEDAKAAGFYFKGNEIRVYPHQYDSVSNVNIYFRLAKFAKLRDARASSVVSDEQLSLNTIERVKRALTIAGWATDESLETFSARIERHILNLCSHVENKADVKHHRWDSDGERCLDCGDKDWFASKYCSNVKKENIKQFSPNPSDCLDVEAIPPTQESEG